MNITLLNEFGENFIKEGVNDTTALLKFWK